MALNSEYAELSVNEIYYDRTFNCRGEFTPQSCLDLAQSIKQHGLQSPVVVQPAEDVEGGIPEDYNYRLIAGHRRFIAVTQLLSQGIIPVQIRKGLSEKQARILNLVENVERKNITLLDEAKAIRAIFPKGTTWDKMAKETNKGKSWCRVRWLIPTLAEEIQQDCAAGRLCASDVAIILAADDKYQMALAQEIKLARNRGESLRQRQRRFTKVRRAKNRTTIREMLADLMSRRIYPSSYRALAWAAGDLTTEEFLEEPYE
ncbi:MAG: ParB/RepB/Spo0J family partition protein [Planctomycetota bacterium]